MTPELESYISSHIDREPDDLYKIDRMSNIRLLNGRMCSGHIQGRLLKMFVRMIAPKRILELGTFSGYSALCLAEGLDNGGLVVTVEADDELEGEIRKNLETSPFGSRVELIIGDALEVMDAWKGDLFDLVFIDADKRAYAAFYEKALNLLNDGGFIIADNTLWDGHVVESVRHSQQTCGVMQFNDAVAADVRVEKVMVPLRDGLTIIRKIPKVND